MKRVIFILFFIIIFTKLFSEELEIEIITGSNYKNNYRMGLINLEVIPQIAIWIEDINGNYIDTIYVTYRTAKSKWRGGKNIRRPSSLPIWSHKRGIKYGDGGYSPTEDNPLPDTMTGATPKASFIKKWQIPSNFSKNEIVIKIEVNKSFDYNEVYRKDLKKDKKYYNDVNGQPSILYEAKINLKQKKNKVNFNFIGHGNVLGENGNIYEDISFLTDALTIIESINAVIKE